MVDVQPPYVNSVRSFASVGSATRTPAALPVVLDARALGQMEISTWRTDAGDLDVLRHLRDESGGRLDYHELEVRSTSVEVIGVDVRLAGLKDIVASKRFAGRDKDRLALPELEQLMRDDED